MGLIPQLDADAAAEALRRLLPRGLIWRDAGILAQIAAFAVEVSRVHERFAELEDEVLTDRADEMMAAWERVLGLPDCGAETPGTLAGRQAVATAKLFGRVGTRLAGLRRIADRLGFTNVTFTEASRHLFRSSQGRSEERLYDWTAAHVLYVDTVGGGDVSTDVFECQLDDAAPGHVLTVYDHS